MLEILVQFQVPPPATPATVDVQVGGATNRMAYAIREYRSTIPLAANE